MEIGMVYSSKDPRQAAARDFVHKYIQDHGIRARVIETERPVQAPMITVDGCSVNGRPFGGNEERRRQLRFPSLDQIAAALEEHLWSL